MRNEGIYSEGDSSITPLGRRTVDPMRNATSTINTDLSEPIAVSVHGQQAPAMLEVKLETCRYSCIRINAIFLKIRIEWRVKGVCEWRLNTARDIIFLLPIVNAENTFNDNLPFKGAANAAVAPPKLLMESVQNISGKAHR